MDVWSHLEPYIFSNLEGIHAAPPVRRRIYEYVRASVRAYPRTPILTLKGSVGGVRRTLLLKLEGVSPWGSIKGRTAYGLIASLAHQISSEDATLVESTSGNLGVALGGICRDLGLRFIAVVEPRLSGTMRDRMQAVGVQLEVIDAPENSATQLLCRIERVNHLIETLPNALWTNQYENSANQQIHAHWTGPEIAAQLGDRAEALFVPVSTGGTLAGISSFVRQAQMSCRIVAVDVVGSVVFGGTPAPRLLTGIGSGKQSTLVDRSSCDEVILVTDREAIGRCRTLAAEVGVEVGGSSGAAIAASLKYFEEHPDVHTAMCLCPDQGDNYRQTIYNDLWLQERGISPEDLRPQLGDGWSRGDLSDSNAHRADIGRRSS